MRVGKEAHARLRVDDRPLVDREIGRILEFLVDILRQRMHIENMLGVHVEVLEGGNLSVIVEGTAFFAHRAYLCSDETVTSVTAFDLGERVCLHACALPRQVRTHPLRSHRHTSMNIEDRCFFGRCERAPVAGWGA